MDLKISIVMPVYNAGEHIEAAIVSVLSQTYSNYELIIIDGCSKDDTINVIQKYIDKIAVFISEKDNGYADALNKGIKKATGDYYVMLAADDYLLKNALHDFASEVYNGVDVWCGNMFCLKEAGIITRFNRVKNENEIRNGEVLAHPACFFRIEAFQKFGYYDTSLPINSDRELILRWLQQGAKFQMSEKYVTVFSCKGMSTEAAYRRKPNELTDDEKVSIEYGLTTQEAHRLIMHDYRRRRIGRIVKQVLGNNYIAMYVIYTLDGQHPLRRKEIKELDINKKYLK